MQDQVLDYKYISAKEAGEKWNISQRRVSTLCSENRIEGCTRVSNVWLIPSNLEKPKDARTVLKIRPDSRAIKPFIKWAGGKGQLLSEINKRYPSELGKTITRYVEPFIGGGAVLFDVLSKFDLKEVIINDINADLVNLYQSIQSNVHELIHILDAYQNDYLSIEIEDRRPAYGKKRDRFNAIHLSGQTPNIEKAALFIFLNKTCFNGLYRVNKKGLYNVPIGSYKNPCICDESNLLSVSKALQNVQIHCGSYLETEKFIDENTFVYVDPPYRPLNATSSFTSYTEFAFGDIAQAELAQFASRIKNKDAKILLSNSDPKNIDENDTFFDDIYKEFIIDRVHATRMINSKSSSRGKITELLIASTGV